jgi:PAS domain S-box-containing protein
MKVNTQPKPRSETTERERLRQELAVGEALNRATLEASLDAVITMDARGVILDFNRAAEAMFGYHRVEAVGRAVADTLVPPSLRERHLAGLHHYLATGEGIVLDSRTELTAMRANGDEFPIELTISRLDLPGPPIFAGFVRDVTDRVEAEHAFHRSMQRLEMMHDIDRAILQGRSTVEMAHRVAEQLAAVVAGDRVSVIVYDEARSEARFLGVAQSGDIGPVEGTIWSMAKFSPDDEVLRPHEPTYIPDLDDVPDRTPLLGDLHTNGIRTLLSCPLMVGDRLIGELSVSGRRAESFSPQDREVVSEIADLLAIGIEQASMREGLEERAQVLEEHVVEFRRTELERRKLLGQLVAAEEKERRSIADGLHDDSIQKMVAVGIRLDTLRRQLSDPKHLASVTELSNSVSATIARLRLLLFELHPRTLEGGWLGDTIREYLELSADPDGPSYAFEDRLEDRLPPDIRTTAYRIMQEALANARKHAKAAHVTIRLEARDEGVYGRVLDDGVGISTDDELYTPGHMGLLAMRDRAERVGGWTRVSRGEELGTVVEFWLPV